MLLMRHSRGYRGFGNVNDIKGFEGIVYVCVKQGLREGCGDIYGRKNLPAEASVTVISWEMIVARMSSMLVCRRLLKEPAA